MTERVAGIVCPSCQHVNLPGTLFCLQCGTYLPSGGPLRTEQFPDQHPQRAKPRGGDEAEDEQQALGIEVEVLRTHRKVLLSADSEILVGRLDAAHGVFPELDLTADSGLEHGISRRHARMYTRHGKWYIEDLDSTNGTFVNDERLTAYLPYVVGDGDILTLGTLGLRINFQGDLPDTGPW
ncbi:MAG: FHA domain-containing protein [Anaerolineae bacterium]|nr:FHA domain-containing protein [Anaerolineae bacterium]